MQPLVEQNQQLVAQATLGNQGEDSHTISALEANAPPAVPASAPAGPEGEQLPVISEEV